MCNMQMAEASEQAFMTFWNGNAAAKEEALSCADALQHQHTMMTCSSQANAMSVFLSLPASFEPEHTEILSALVVCMLELGDTAAAYSILDTIDIIKAKILQ